MGNIKTPFEEDVSKYTLEDAVELLNHIVVSCDRHKDMQNKYLSTFYTKVKDAALETLNAIFGDTKKETDSKKIKAFVECLKEIGFFEVKVKGVPASAFPYRTVLRCDRFKDGNTTLIINIDTYDGYFSVKWYPREGKVMTRVFPFSIADEEFEVSEENANKIVRQTISEMKSPKFAEYLNTEPTHDAVLQWRDELESWERV